MTPPEPRIGSTMTAATRSLYGSSNCEQHPVERRSVAASAFGALINGFFISLAALVPAANLGASALAVGLVSLVVMALLGRELASGQLPLARARRLALVALSGVLYALECWRGVQLLLQPDQPGPVSALATLLLVVYALGIVRAWELVGAERYGLLGRLSPLRDLDDAAATPGRTAVRPTSTG
jgi:hypothetical protein